MKKYLFLLGACAVIVLGSCSTGEAATAAMMLGGSSQAPVFLNHRTVSENEIEFEFSQPVKVTSLSFEPALTISSIEEGNIVRVTLGENTEPGVMLTADLLAEDSKNNTINVLIPFRSRNNRMPKLVINEFRTEYTNPRVEFIEFKLLTAGNLGAMRVFMAGGSQKPSVYEFSPVEVAKGEYVVLHLRKREDECRDEYGSNLAESGGTGSSPDARDIWVPDTTKLINKASGYIYVLDQDDNVLDAVMYSEKPDTWWTKDYLAEAAEFLYGKGAWKAPDGSICTPADAVSSVGTTATRTICRDTAENSGTAANWYVTVTSGATPGKLNNPNRYSP